MEKACPFCAPLLEGAEVEDSVLPSPFEKLVFPNPALEKHFRVHDDETILCCPECGRYFHYRLWTPGGSEDAMRTYVHESVGPIGPVGMISFLCAEIARFEAYNAEGKRWWDDNIRCLKEGLAVEKEKLAKRPEAVVEVAAEILAERRSEKVPEHYRQGVRAFELETADILAEFLALIPESAPFFPPLLNLLDEKPFPDLAEKLQNTLIAAIDRIDRAGEGDVLTPLLEKLQSGRKEKSPSAEFLATCVQAHTHRIDGVYNRVLRSCAMTYLFDGTRAKCPKCGSHQVHQGDRSAYEFTNMVCDSCGYDTLEDDWELEKWYPQE